MHGELQVGGEAVTPSQQPCLKKQRLVTGDSCSAALQSSGWDGQKLTLPAGDFSGDMHT